MQNKKIIQVGIIFMLLFPFIILLFKLTNTVKFDFEEFFWALKNTTIQAFLSALVSIFFGFILTMGLLSYQNLSKFSASFDLFFLLPNFLPSLFIVIGLMNLIDPFPLGLIGIVLAHVFINTGLVAIYFKNALQLKLGHCGELALVLGISRFKFISKVVIPQLKQDFVEVFFYVFSVCFSSFAIPLIIGGGRGTNLEVLIFEKIRISMDWSSAVWIALVQSFILFAISFLSFRHKQYQNTGTFNFSIISSKKIVYLFVIGYVVFFASFFKGIFEGLNFLNDFYLFKSELISGIFGTLLLSGAVGIFILFYLLLLSYVWSQDLFSKFLLGYIAPSSALTALAFLLVGSNEGYFVYVKVIFALALLYSSLAYRFGWNSIMHELQVQKERGIIFGASDKLIYKKIVLPLVIKKAFFISGVCAFWTSGEFAISKIIGQSDFTLAMITETFISQYRLGLASILTVVLLLLGIFIFYLFIGVGSVVSKKVENSI